MLGTRPENGPKGWLTFLRSGAVRRAVGTRPSWRHNYLSRVIVLFDGKGQIRSQII